MKYGLIDPKAKTANVAAYPDIVQAEKAIGLQPGCVDHGLLDRSQTRVLGIVVDEFGLFKPTAEQNYFAIGKHLYAGPAVIYLERREDGAPIDVEELPPIRWFDDAKAVEQAIEMGEITQPSMSIGEEVIWVWPQPGPADTMQRLEGGGKK